LRSYDLRAGPIISAKRAIRVTPQAIELNNGSVRSVVELHTENLHCSDKQNAQNTNFATHWHLQCHDLLLVSLGWSASYNISGSLP
jgi:hypothetical protein